MRPKPEPLLDVPPVERPAGRVLPPFQVMRAATQNTRMMHVTLRGLLAHKNWVFAAMAVAFCLSAYVYWSNPPLYSSTVSFYVLEPPVQDMDHPIYLSLRTDAVTLRHIAASTAMFDHLIDTYGLHAHYGIQDGSANDRARLYQMLQARVVVDLRESDIVAVMVKDADRALVMLSVLSITCR